MDSHPHSRFENYNSKYFEKAYSADFRRIHAVSKRIATGSLSRKDKHLRSLIHLVLDNQTPTEYPFLFKYSYGEVEDEAQALESIAAAIHLLQTSTFVIDDIFDASGVRNHSQTLFGKYGVDYSVLIGEILQTAASEAISVEIGRAAFENKSLVSTILHGVLRKVYIGQYLDIYNSANPNVTANEYYRIISFTTAYFLSDIARCGALLAGKSEAETDALTEYGYRYGMALQVTDDVIDLTVPSHITGKSFASDLKCRRMRLPFIMALKMSDAQGRKFLKEFLATDAPSDSEVKDVVKLIINCGALQACVVIANNYLGESLKCLDSIDEGLTSKSLRWLSERLSTIQEWSR